MQEPKTRPKHLVCTQNLVFFYLYLIIIINVIRGDAAVVLLFLIKRRYMYMYDDVIIESPNFVRFGIHLSYSVSNNLD